MKLHTLALSGYRNYEDCRAELSPGVNLLYGENAQGKTNFLESIYYLSCGKSHRTRFDRELISFSRGSAVIRGELECAHTRYDVQVLLSRQARRQVTVNGVKRAAKFGQEAILRTVLFCPEDLYLVRAGAAVRRRFLDMAIGQMRPRYAGLLSEYAKLYEHKTRILRDWAEKPSLLDMLEEFNFRLIRVGAELIRYRARFASLLSQKAEEIHREFSGAREALSLCYQSAGISGDAADPSVEEIASVLQLQQERLAQAERSARLCLCGPHKDDLLLSLDGTPARQFASQGQTRTIALSLKLAERQMHYEDTGEYPILLLDDVLSELDARRQDYVIRRISGGQVFITCCEVLRLEHLDTARLFHIRGGAVILG